jgi:hypothetical protein
MKYGPALASHKSLLLFFSLIVIWTNPSQAQERFVKDNMLVSDADPRLAIRFESPFEYVGVHDFDIRGIAGGTRHVFVDADGAYVRRMFILQLEGFYPNNPGVYRYDLSDSPVVAGYPWRSNGWAFDLAAFRIDDPGNESSITAGFLEGLGYELPELVLMWRSLTVVNETRTHEAILFLLEAGEPLGLRMQDLFDGDEDTPRWKAIQGRMEQDFYDLVSLSVLADDGTPTGEWKKIGSQR